MTEQGKSLMQMVVDAYARPAFPHMRKAPTDLESATSAFEHDAEYRMERLDDIAALEKLGEDIAKAFEDADLASRSNLKGYTHNAVTDAIHGLCDGLDFNGADIVRFSALNIMEKRS